MLFSVNAPIVELLDEAQCLELDATLVERIYEFNSEATGYTDGGEACVSSRISG